MMSCRKRSIRPTICIIDLSSRNSSFLSAFSMWQSYNCPGRPVLVHFTSQDGDNYGIQENHTGLRVEAVQSTKPCFQTSLADGQMDMEQLCWVCQRQDQSIKVLWKRTGDSRFPQNRHGLKDSPRPITLSKITRCLVLKALCANYQTQSKRTGQYPGGGRLENWTS